MVGEIVWTYLHFIALIGTIALLVAEAALCRGELRGAALHRLKHVDLAYFAFAMAALLTGAARVFLVGKGSAYYLSSPVFHAKFGLFLLIGLISVAPTLRFLSWSRQARTDAGFAPPAAAVSRVRGLLALELALAAMLPLLGALLANGVRTF